MARQLDNGDVLCEQCGNDYKRIGMHWSTGSCDYPPIHPYLKEIITGLMMGDGTLGMVGKSPNLQVGMISKNYLEYLDDIFGWFSSSVSLMKTAEDGAAQCRRSGWSPDAEASDYNDVYRLTTRSHPELSEFDWYGSGKKVWPDDIELTPAVLTHWYCGDGTRIMQSTIDGIIKIGMSNEVENTEKVASMFDRVGLPIPRFETRKESDDYTSCTAIWGVWESYELWEYMETPPPDFHYKFPEEYHTP